MIDSGIIKALKCCSVPNAEACSECPLFPLQYPECMVTKSKNALDLIYHQNEEIEGLNRHISKLNDHINILCEDKEKLVSQRDEYICRLAERINYSSQPLIVSIPELTDVVRTYIKFEAVKEFARELITNLDGDIEAYANAGHSLNVYEWLISYMTNKGVIEND